MTTTINTRNLGFKIGLIYCILSFLLTFTFLIPIFSVMPGSLVELFASYFVKNDPYDNVGKATITIFLIILVVFLFLVLYGIRNIASKGVYLKSPEIILFMSIFYFIIHPLGFYLYWAFFLNFRGDGQLIFGAVTSFPDSSISFIRNID